MVVMDGAGSQFLRAQAGLDNLSQSTDPTRQVPAFVLVEVANDQRSIELDTMCDLWARYVAEEVFPAVESNAATKAGRIPHQDVEPVPVLITEVEVPISSECGRNRQHRPGAGNEQPRGVASDRPRRHHDASGFVSIGRRAAWRQSGIGLED
jgi:hypothetical protein